MSRKVQRRRNSLFFPPKKNKKILKRFDQLADPLRPIEGKRMQESMTSKKTIKS